MKKANLLLLMVAELQFVKDGESSKHIKIKKANIHIVWRLAVVSRLSIWRLAQNVKTLNFYSDSCSGQNRKIYQVIMLCYALKELPATSSISEINHKFLEPGHTHMEADSMHAKIERA
nr:unnamed protein product [Callosobruchus analis]